MKDQAVVKAIITMSHALGKQVIAEGVETQAQLDFLIQHQCDKAQGFLLNKPQAVDDINQHIFNPHLSKAL